VLSQKDYKSAAFLPSVQAGYCCFWKKIFCFEKLKPIIFCRPAFLKGICGINAKSAKVIFQKIPPCLTINFFPHINIAVDNWQKEEIFTICFKNVG